MTAAVLLAPSQKKCELSQIPADVSDICFRLAQSAKIVHFTYEIEELLECGEPRILWMYENLTQSGSQAVIYVNDGIVCTESLDALYIVLLEQIRSDGGDRDYMSGSGLTSDEINEFLAFALQEGIILNARPQ